ncbi:kinase-like protein [Xylaria sp. FL1777]|nr:kinase-like protein [Xylaria sp. FL1777]
MSSLQNPVMPSLSRQSSGHSSQYSDSLSDLSRQSSGQSSQHSTPSSYNSNGQGLYHKLSSRIYGNDEEKEPQALSRVSFFSFLPIDAIDEVITIDVVKAQLPYIFDYTKAKLTLADLIKAQIPWPFSYNIPRFSEVVEQSKKILAILGLCEAEKYFWYLLSEGLTDEHLPLARITCDKCSNTLISSRGTKVTTFSNKGGNIVVENFLKKQWQVLAPVFTTLGEDIKIEGNAALPFYDVKMISFLNDRSTVYRGTLHAAHIMPKPKADVKIAIKDYTHQDDFDKEKDNLLKIQNLNNPHLIRHIATIQQGNLFYVIFPWANGGNLSEFWMRPHASQARSPKLFMWCFQQMLGMVDALFVLHDMNYRHGDLKPENILHFKGSSNSDARYGKYGSLVIADVGVSKVHIEATESRKKGTTTKATTPCYEAPEAEIDDGKPRGRRYDMWSVGCIFMEFAIWLLYGYEAINGFKELRRANDDPFPQKAAYYRRTGKNTAEIHPIASDGLSALKNDPRCAEGTALADLVSLIAEDLIVIDPKKRANAKELKDKLREILRKAEKDPGYLMRSVGPPPRIPHPFTPG